MSEWGSARRWDSRYKKASYYSFYALAFALKLPSFLFGKAFKNDAGSFSTISFFFFKYLKKYGCKLKRKCFYFHLRKHIWELFLFSLLGWSFIFSKNFITWCTSKRKNLFSVECSNNPGEKKEAKTRYAYLKQYNLLVWSINAVHKAWIY